MITIKLLIVISYCLICLQIYITYVYNILYICSPPTWQQQSQQLIENLLVSENSSDWIYDGNNNGIDIYHKRDNSTQQYTFKGIGIVNTQASVVGDVLHNTSMRRSYDELFECSNTIEIIDNVTQIEHWKFWVCNY